MALKIEEEPLTNEPGYRGPSWMLKHANKDNRIALISPLDVQSSNVPVTATDGYESLCSYNWTMSHAPTIYIPGSLRKWDPPALPKQLNKPANKGGPRQEHMKEHSFEPVFKALETMNPSVRFNDVDIVVNRHTLQLLYKFASQRTKFGEICLDLQLVNKTLIITRRQRETVANVWGAGYEPTFRDEFTEQDPYLREAERHFRTIKYRLGNLNIVVRMEPSGYFDRPPRLNEANAPHEVSSNYLYGKSSWNAPKNFDDVQETKVVCQGIWIPHNDIMELAIKGRWLVEEQLWFGRIRHAIFAAHERGLVQATEIVNWTVKDMETYADDNQENLRRLVWLLEVIRQTVVDKTKGAAVLVARDHGEPLQIFEASSDGALESKIIGQFWVEEV